MDGWRSRLLILILGLKALSANAEGAFGVSEVSESGVQHKCYGFELQGSYYAPSHCFQDSRPYYLHSARNPLHATPIIRIQKVQSEDLSQIYVETPPKGELNQRVVSCLTSPLGNNKFLHSCINLKAGDSGSLITNEAGEIVGIHLGIIYYAGKQFGYGLKYQSIIEHNLHEQY